MEWKFKDEELKKIYKENKYDIKMSYEEFKRMAEKYANELITKTKKYINVKESIK